MYQLQITDTVHPMYKAFTKLALFGARVYLARQQ
jgi:hypothetical protein